MYSNGKISYLHTNTKKNNNIDMYTYLAYQKQQHNIEKQIWLNIRKQSKFDTRNIFYLWYAII